MREHLSKNKRRNAEEGLTLVEILVAISLLAIVTVMVVSLINTTMNSASRFSNVSTSQSQVSNAMNLIQRDLSAAQKIVSASTNAVSIITRDGGKDVKVTYFAYDRLNANSIPAGITVADEPDYDAVIQARQVLASDGSVVSSGTSVIVKGYAIDGFSNSEKHRMFDFYNKANTQVTVPATDSGTALSNTSAETINRVEFRISAMVDGRGTPIQLESSATINSSRTQASVGSEFYSGVPECPANISVTIDPDGISAPQTTAVLNWYSPIGATSYTIYMNDVSRSVAKDNVVITDPTTLSYTFEGLDWGTTYSWAVQANGPGGTSGLCGPTQGTVIPDVINFANINSLATINATKSGAGAENLSRAAETGIPAKSVSTGSPASGLRYTVARGLQNQLSWTSTYGVQGYRIYEPTNLNAPLATITAAGTQFHQLPASYGDVSNYVIRAYNAGGESLVSQQVTLISPPRASAATASDPDTSTRSTTTDSIITIATRVNNTEGFRLFKSEGYDAANQNLCNPATWTAAPSLNFLTGSVTDTGSLWGSNSCYRLVPFNDAGPGVPFTASVLHKPGKFAITQAINTSTMRVIDTNRDLNGGAGGLSLPWCWADPTGHSVANDMNCRGEYGHRPYAYLPLGMFGTVNNEYTNIALRWNQSQGAYKDYSVVRNRLATSSARVDQSPAAAITTNAAYVNGGQGINYNYEMPGSVYRFTVTSKAQNDLTRQRVTEMVTKPDIPHHMQGIYYIKDFGDYNGTRINLNVHVSAIRGMADSIRVGTIVTGQGWKYETRNISNAYETFSGNYQTIPGANQRYATTILTRTITEAEGLTDSRTSTVTVESDSIGRDGYLTGFTCPPGPGSCSDANGKSQVTSGYPLWWTGAPSRYWSGGVAHDGSQVVSSTVAVPVPDGPQLTSPEEGLNICIQTPEDDGDFAANCTYGEGIPVAPTVTALQSGTTQNFSWTSWPGVTEYKVTYRINNGTATTVTKTAGDRTLPLTVPIGQTASVSVIAMNEINEGPAGTATATTAPAIPTGVNATVSGSNITVTWNASPGATSYVVESTRNGTVNSVTVTGTTATLSSLEDGSYQIRVRAVAGGASSDLSPVVIRNIVPATPAIISDVNIYAGTAPSWNIDFVHNGGTVIYNAQITGPNGYTFNSTDYTTSSPTGTRVQNFYFQAATNGKYTVTINAFNQGGVKSTYTRVVDVRASMPLPGAPTTLVGNKTTDNKLTATYRSGTSSVATEVEIIDRATNAVVNQQKIAETTAGAVKTVTTSLASGSYTIKVRSVSATGVTSAWVTSQYSF